MRDEPVRTSAWEAVHDYDGKMPTFTLSRFPAKMTLAHSRAVLSIEKISYSSSNLTLSNILTTTKISKLKPRL